MADSISSVSYSNSFARWLMAGITKKESANQVEHSHQTHSWWQVMCLTGLDYFIIEALQAGQEIRIVANRSEIGDASEYRLKEKEKRSDNHITQEESIIFLEIRISDASEFTGVMRVRGVEIGGYHILRTKNPAVPNAIAALLLHIRDAYGALPHAYFGWTEGSHLAYAFKFIAFGEGDTAPVTREILRKAEPDPDHRPSIHGGGKFFHIRNIEASCLPSLSPKNRLIHSLTGCWPAQSKKWKGRTKRSDNITRIPGGKSCASPA